jgi:hypothetical protein
MLLLLLLLLLLLHTVSDTHTRVDQRTPTCGDSGSDGGGDGGGDGGDGGGGGGVVQRLGAEKENIYGKDRGVNETNSPTWFWCLSSYTLR